MENKNKIPFDEAFLFFNSIYDGYGKSIRRIYGENIKRCNDCKNILPFSESFDLQIATNSNSMEYLEYIYDAEIIIDSMTDFLTGKEKNYSDIFMNYLKKNTYFHKYTTRIVNNREDCEDIFVRIDKQTENDKPLSTKILLCKIFNGEVDMLFINFGCDNNAKKGTILKGFFDKQIREMSQTFYDKLNKFSKSVSKSGLKPELVKKFENKIDELRKTHKNIEIKAENLKCNDNNCKNCNKLLK